MIDAFVFFVCIVIAVRTAGYGIWTLRSKNILGGIFVLFLSGILTALSIYLLIFDRT